MTVFSTAAVLKRWAPWILMALIVGLMVHFLDLHATLAALDEIALPAIVLTVALFLLDRFSMAYKWNFLLRTRDCWLSNWAAFRIYLASGFVGYVIPASVGSDAFRATRLSMTGRSGSTVSATIVLERVLGLLAILALSTVGLTLVVLRGRSDLLPLLGAVSAGLCVGMVLAAISMSARLYQMLRRMTARFGDNRVVQALHAMHDEYVFLGKGGRTLAVFFCLSIVNLLVQVLMFFPVLVSLDVPVEPLTLLAVLPLNKLLIQLMPVPAGLGVAEGSQVIALSLAHVAPAQGLAVALVLRAIDLSMLLPAGIAYAADAWQLRRTA